MPVIRKKLIPVCAKLIEHPSMETQTASAKTAFPGESQLCHASGEIRKAARENTSWLQQQTSIASAMHKTDQGETWVMDRFNGTRDAFTVPEHEAVASQGCTRCSL